MLSNGSSQISIYFGVSKLCSLLLGIFGLLWGLLSGIETIGDTLNIENKSGTGEDPFCGVVLGLELSSEHIRFISVSGHVAGALVDTLVNLTILYQQSFAVNNGDNRELNLGDRFFHLAGVLLPGSTFELETKHIGTIFDLLEHGRNLRLPMELLENISLDVKLVETLSSLLGTDLLNSSEIRVRLVESVQEADGLVDQSRIIFP